MATRHWRGEMTQRGFQMKRTIRNKCVLVLGLLALLCSAVPARAASLCTAQDTYTLLIHGGFLASASEVGPERQALIRTVLEQGQGALAQGARALDVVVQTLVAMEDSGLLDAGKGSIVNTQGDTETDASIMDGPTGRSGRWQLCNG